MAEHLISVVIPCYNEAACLPVFFERVEKMFNDVSISDYEILAVNDGSTDDTAVVLEKHRLANPRLGVIQFVRNFGHQAALSAGLAHARGAAVICMDADLQHPPELIPDLIQQWRRGYDVVQAVRKTQPGLAKSLSSRAFYLILRLFSDVEVRSGAADFRLMSRRAVDSLLDLPERSRFLRGLVAWLGFPCTTIEFDAPPRHAGRSAYSLRRMIRFAEDALVALSDRPLHLALWIASFTLLAALIYAVYILRQFVISAPLVKGWPSTILLVLIMGSVNLICTGILGLYLRAVLVEIRKRPDYLIAAYMPPVRAFPLKGRTEPIAETGLSASG